jgi:cell division protein FtsL
MTVTVPTPTPTRTRPSRRPEVPATEAPDTALLPDASSTERPSGRPRTAAAQRAYARRAQREGRKPERDEPAESPGGRARFVVLIIALLVVGIAATLWLSTQAISDSYRLEQARKEATDLSERADTLQREVTKLDSPSALAQRAKELGMVFPGDPARLVVQPDGTITVVGDPKPAQAPAVPPPTQPTQTAQPPAAGAEQPSATGQQQATAQPGQAPGAR